MWTRFLFRWASYKEIVSVTGQPISHELQLCRPIRTHETLLSPRAPETVLKHAETWNYGTDGGENLWPKSSLDLDLEPIRIVAGVTAI
jgi:hypothetical protein